MKYFGGKYYGEQDNNTSNDFEEFKSLKKRARYQRGTDSSSFLNSIAHEYPPTPTVPGSSANHPKTRQDTARIKSFRDLIIGVISLLSCLASAYNAGYILYYHSSELEDWWGSFLALSVFSLLTLSLSVVSFILYRRENSKYLLLNQEAQHLQKRLSDTLSEPELRPRFTKTGGN